MARVPRASRQSRVLTEVQPDYRPEGFAQSEMYQGLKRSFEIANEFIYPAVAQEQTIRGEQEANEAFEAGRFALRHPFSIRDRAFNTSGERLVTNRAMLDLDDGLREALERADGNMQVLQSELDRVRGTFGELPTIPGLQTSWNESFERGSRAAIRRTTEIAEARARAAARAAASAARQTSEEELRRLAYEATAPEDLLSVVETGAEEIARSGPREAFVANGVSYPADPERTGVMSAERVEREQDELMLSSQKIFLEGELRRTDDPGALADQIISWATAPYSPIRLGVGDTIELVRAVERRGREEESKRLEEERAVAERLANAAAENLDPYVSAVSNGVAVPIPQDVVDSTLLSVSGNPELRMQVETTIAAHDHMTALTAMTPSQRQAYVDDLRAQIASDGVVTPQEAETLNRVVPYLEGIRSAITAESLGIPAMEIALSSGALPSDEAIATMAAAAEASGSEELVRGVAAIGEAVAAINDNALLPIEQRQELIEGMQDTINASQAAGNFSSPMVAAAFNKSMDLALSYLNTMETMAQENPMRFLGLMGVDVAPFPAEDTSTLTDVAAMIVERAGATNEIFARYGVQRPVPLSRSENAGVSEWLRSTNNMSRIGFLETLTNGLPTEHAAGVMEALGQSDSMLMAAGHVAGHNVAAANTILAGASAPELEPKREMIVSSRIRALGPLVDMGVLPPDEIERLDEVATAYARGMAAQDGDTEIDQRHLLDGYDIALGADENGDGGLEDLGDFGMTILPTGMQGHNVEDYLRRAPAEFWEEVAGGPITDSAGRAFEIRELFGYGARNIVAVQPIAGGLYVPLDVELRYFATPKGPLAFEMDQLENAIRLLDAEDDR